MQSIIIFIISGLMCSGAAASVITLGEIEVEGSVRKPLINYVDTDRAARELGRRIALQKIKQFEAELLQPDHFNESNEENSHAHLPALPLSRAP